MPFNFDTSGTLNDKYSESDKIQYLIANLITIDWDNLNTDDWEIIASYLRHAHKIAEQEHEISVESEG